MRLLPIRVYQDAHFTLSRDILSLSAVLSVRRARGAADYEDHYIVLERELAEFLADDRAVDDFAARAERRELEGRLLPTEEATRFIARDGRLRPIRISRDPRYSLERNALTGEPVFGIPVSSSFVEYEEWYSISEAELTAFLADEEAARAFAFRCGRRELDERLILKPGTRRGSYSG